MAVNNVKESLEDVSESVVKRLNYYKSRAGITHILSSPTTIWFGTLYLSTLVMMISLNIARLGLNLEGIFGGPKHYMEVFLTFGLNATSVRESTFYSGILPWIIGPFLVSFMGLAFFYLADAGFAANGPREDPLGSFYFAFFKSDVFGFEVHFFGDKVNVFYLSLVWIPIIAASIATIYVKRRQLRDTSIVTRFIINMFFAFIIGNEMGRMSDPDLYYSFSGFFRSLFVDRKFNHFVVFDGTYHPSQTALYITLIQIIPMIVMGVIEASLLGYSYYFERKAFLAKLQLDRKEMQMELDEDTDLLPWEEDLEKRKQEIADTKKEIKK